MSLEDSEIPSNKEQTNSNEDRIQKARQSDWPLEDILDFSPEVKNESGKVVAHTAGSYVEKGELEIEFSKEGSVLTFQTSEPQYIIERIENKNPFALKFEEQEGKHTLAIPDFEIKVSIAPPSSDTENNLSTINIEANRYGTAWLKDSLKSLGMSELLKNNSISDEITPEYAQKLIEEGTIKIGSREIPIKLVSNPNELKEVVSEKDNKTTRVYHGTSLTGALSVANVGFFSERPDTTRPVLSAEPDIMATKLAKDEWSGYPRTDPSGYGAIIVFNVHPTEVKSHGIITNNVGRIEEIFQPAKQMIDDNERYRLQRHIRNARIPANTPGYIPPERVSQIILIKQTPRNH